MLRKMTLYCIFTIAFQALPTLSATESTQISDFELQDFRGKHHSLATYLESNQLVVCVFLGTECPLAKLYGPRLAELAGQFKESKVAFLGINSNQQDSPTEIASYARRHGIGFPILKDVANRVADQMKAKRTPEVYLLDSRGKVRYRGRIDDQFGVGYVREAPQQQDLKRAITELLADGTVSTPSTEAVGCLIGRVRVPEADSPVTYSKQVSRILQNRCVECHREGEIAPFTLRSYDEVVGWAEMIAEVVQEGRMPPWHADPAHGKFVNDRSLTRAEKTLLIEWAERGAPEGDLEDLPEPRQFVTGSQLPRPADLELNMRTKPFVVEAEGVVAYQYFEVDPGFEEDKWVTMAEAVPGNRSVVHHIVVFVRAPKNNSKSGIIPGLEFLTTYVPGYRARPLPTGMAKLVPAGSKLVFQMHYTPIGTHQEDLSKLRLVFTDKSEVERMVVTSAVQIKRDKLIIPPHASNHRSEAMGRLEFDDAELLSLFPHMHLRGKAFRIETLNTENEAETLLNVPTYDFNWQTTYRLQEPLKLAQGTAIKIVGHHDNSGDNLANPDPEVEVHWGDQTWEEMLVALFEWSVPMP